MRGSAVKANGQVVEGFAELNLAIEGKESIQISNTVKKGYFELNFTIPKETKAGQYTAKLSIYEKD